MLWIKRPVFLPLAWSWQVKQIGSLTKFNSWLKQSFLEEVQVVESFSGLPSEDIIILNVVIMVAVTHKG